MDVRRTASRLSGDEVALVLRRAADIEAEVEGPGAVDGFEPAAVEEAAREVGLSPTAVRQALAELHAGALAPAERSTLRARVRGTGPAPHLAVEARLVSSAAETVHTTAAGFLRRQAFDLRRHHGDRAVYRQRTDVGARLRRLANVRGSVQLTGVRSVTVAVTPLGPPAGEPGRGHGDGRPAGASPRSDVPRHMVRVEAEVVGGGMGARARAAAGAVALGGTAALVTLVATGGFLLAAAAGVAGTVATRWWLGRRLLGRRRDEVREVLAALLDVVEDPAATTRAPALGPAWSSRWAAPESPAPTDAPWSPAVGWRSGRPDRASRPAR